MRASFYRILRRVGLMIDHMAMTDIRDVGARLRESGARHVISVACCALAIVVGIPCLGLGLLGVTVGIGDVSRQTNMKFGLQALEISFSALFPSVVWFWWLLGRRRRRRDPLKCEACGYDLRGSLESERCPECGKAFSPDEVSQAVAMLEQDERADSP